MPSRLVKRIARTALVLWREQPSRRDIEAVHANVRRVGLVIRVRWALVGVLAVFSLAAAASYMLEVPAADVFGNMRIPAAALAFVLLYNTFYQSTYKRLGNIAFLNHAQLLFDGLVSSVLVYYSGGIYSWFATMYLLIILEGAFILPRNHVWLLAFACAAMYGMVVWPEYLGWLPHVSVPFVTNTLQSELAYVTVRYLWKTTVMLGTATVGTLIVSDIDARERKSRSIRVLDESTGLCNRAYFRQVLSEELERVARTGLPLAIVLVDIDALGEFNQLFGLEAGDRMLKSVAADVDSTVREGVTGRVRPEGLVCRYGGEEFAALLPDTDETVAVAVAERIRETVSRLRVADGSVTVSIGVATYPADAGLAEDLLDAADRALSVASEGRGNRVVSASSTRVSTAVIDG